MLLQSSKRDKVSFNTFLLIKIKNAFDLFRSDALFADVKRLLECYTNVLISNSATAFIIFSL